VREASGARAVLVQRLAEALDDLVVHVLVVNWEHRVDVPGQRLQREEQVTPLAAGDPVVAAQARTEDALALRGHALRVRGRGAAAHVAQRARKELPVQRGVLRVEQREHARHAHGLAVLAAVLPAEDARARLAVAAHEGEPVARHALARQRTRRKRCRWRKRRKRGQINGVWRAKRK